MRHSNLCFTMIMAALVSLASSLGHAATQDCTDAQKDQVTLYPMTIVLSDGTELLYGIGVEIASGDGTMKDEDEGIVADPKYSDADDITLDCTNYGHDGEVTKATASLPKNFYVCDFPTGQVEAAETNAFKLAFDIVINGETCEYRRSITFKDAHRVYPETANKESFEKQYKGSDGLDYKVAGFLMTYDGLYGLDDDETPYATDECPYAEGEDLGDDCETDDTDGDGEENDEDNCPFIYNPKQADADDDEIGDVCDMDRDDDDVDNFEDNCPDDANEDQKDTDEDGVGDACLGKKAGADGKKTDGTKETCTIEGYLNSEVGGCTTPNTFCVIATNTCESTADADKDGVPDIIDNCPQVADPTNACKGTAPAPGNFNATAPYKPAKSAGEGGGGCTLSTEQQHADGTYLVLALIALLSIFGLTRVEVSKGEGESK